MIPPVRWRKLARDFDAMSGRIMMMAAAIAVGVLAVATIATAYAILTREISRNYLATRPASALIDAGPVNQAVLEAVRADPDVEAVEPGAIVTGRARLPPGEWGRMLLFVTPDFNNLAINKVFPNSGAFPPPKGSILLEREALALLKLTIGGKVDLETPTGQKLAVPVSGTVHDPSLAPAWQEQTVYGYVSPATYAALGGTPQLDLLKVVVRDAAHDQARVDAVIARIAANLRENGVTVHQVQAPPTGRHPHQTQMTAVLAMFVIFTLLTLVLSAILTASMIDSLLAQQKRQIAVMKAIGARSTQIASLYLGGVVLIAATATAIGIPLGAYGGLGFAGIIARLLNFDIASHAIPPALVVALIFAGVGIPALFALVPIRTAIRRTVRETLSDAGVRGKEFGTSRFDTLLASIGGVDRSLVLAIRNAFRRRGRLLLTLALLGAAGAMFLASLSVENAWNNFIAASAEDRTYDLEFKFARPVETAPLLAMLGEIPGVIKAEPANSVPAAPARPDGLAFVRTYPDGGHGSLTLRALPQPESLKHLIVLEGKLRPTVRDGEVILNQGARILLGGLHPGDRVTLTVEGRTASYSVAAVVREILALPSVYTSSEDFDAVAGTKGRTRSVRIGAARRDAATLTALSAAIETRLEAAGIRVMQSVTETQVNDALSGHVRILIVALIAMSVLMAIVGVLGLASALGSNVAERTREFGVMRTIGATNQVIIRNILAEGLFTGLISVGLAVLFGVPLAAFIGRLVGTLSFGLPLPLAPSAAALAMWITGVTIGAATASLPPALTATRLTVRQTLSYN